MARKPRTPSLRLHKTSGRAVVTIDGKDRYLGDYGSKPAQAEYDRLIAEWLSNGRRMPVRTDLSVNELMLAYLQHARGYYLKRGKLTSEFGPIRTALRHVKSIYGTTCASDFGPSALKAIRQRMLDVDLSRSSINKLVGIVRRMFRWAVSEELVPASVIHGLSAVDGLKRGRTTARETARIKPVPQAHVDAIIPHVSKQVAALIGLQSCTGMRPGEVCSMRAIDIDMTGTLWLYRPSEHKTEHHDIDRVIHLGRHAQEIIRPFLTTDRSKFLFDPRDAEDTRHAEQRRNRRSKVTPSQAARRRKRRPDRTPRDRYTSASYRRAIDRACRIVFGVDDNGKSILSWHPNQLRHNFATAVRKQYGIEAARIMLGHTKIATTELYAERDATVAAEVAAQVG